MNSKEGCTISPPKRGRPVALPLAERRELLLDALGQVYEANGHESLTMDAVARMAGMSKRTVYSVFADRGAMFIAYFERVRPYFIRELGAEYDGCSLAERLRLMLAPQSEGPTRLPIDILRSLVAEAPDRPEMAHQFLLQVRGHAIECVAAELERAQKRGEIAPCDPALTASVLLDMVKPNILELLLGGTVCQSLPDRQARFETGLRIALAGLMTTAAPKKHAK